MFALGFEGKVATLSTGVCLCWWRKEPIVAKKLPKIFDKYAKIYMRAAGDKGKKNLLYNKRK